MTADERLKKQREKKKLQRDNESNDKKAERQLKNARATRNECKRETVTEKAHRLQKNAEATARTHDEETAE